jgi:NAD(P)-dependent dehydrogenase (short-subunit alcohol dehydrogenase family)
MNKAIECSRIPGFSGDAQRPPVRVTMPAPGTQDGRFIMGKVALVTGASSGMGKAAALKLAREGYIVYGAARRVEEMRELSDAGGHPVKLDVTNEEEMAACVNRIVEEQGGIDVLINNAGFGLYGSVEETSMADARYQLEVNLFGAARLTQLALPHMRARKSGTIINITSMGGKIYTPLGAWYHAAKHALEGFSDCLRLELKQFGINVIIIEPGIILTSFGDVMIAPMLKRSGAGPYEKLARSVAASAKTSYSKGGGSSPEIIAELISKALKAKNPATRYAAGKMAKPLIFIRKWFGDGVYDRLVMSQIK